MATAPKASSYFKDCFKPTYRVKWLKNKGAILIIIWSYLTTAVFHLLKAGYKGDSVHPSGIILISTALLYPIGGWIGDTCLGRYKVIRCSMWIMWISVMLATVNDILADITVSYEVHSESIYRGLCVVLGIGLAGFQSNIVQLGIDQLTDASASEVTSFISWYTLTLYASWITIHYTTDCIAEEHNRLCFKHLVVALCLTVALCLDFLFQHLLIKEHIVGKPLSLIINVLKHTIRNRCLKYSIHNEELPSRFDVAKHRYGGSFTAQQVDNVRMFLWILAVIAMCATVYGAVTPIEFTKEYVVRHHLLNSGNGLTSCYTTLISGYNDYIFAIVLLLVYEFVIHPFLYRCLPKISIMTTFLYGTALLFLLIISLLCIEIATYYSQLNLNNTQLTQCIFMDDQYPLLGINRTWLFVPGFLSGLSILLLVISGFEFLWSQAPSTMKGMIVGLAYAFLGLHTLLHTAISSPFVFKSSLIKWEHASLTCGTWYFLMEGAIVLIVLIIISVLVRLHKLKKKKGNISDTFLESST